MREYFNNTFSFVRKDANGRQTKIKKYIKEIYG